MPVETQPGFITGMIPPPATITPRSCQPCVTVGAPGSEAGDRDIRHPAITARFSDST